MHCLFFQFPSNGNPEYIKKIALLITFCKNIFRNLIYGTNL